MKYQISDEKLKEVFSLIREYVDATPTDIEDFILADWDEGQEHQDWLDFATAQKIADWVSAGLK